MSKFGDLIAGTVTTTEETAVVETPVVEEVVAEVPPTPPVEPVETEVSIDYSAMSKDELEDYGRTVGIELDRRHNKKKLIKELEDHTKSV